MPLYQDWHKRQSALLRVAATFHNPAVRIAPLVVMTDPAVHDDVAALAARAPKGCAIIYRHFGSDNREAVAHHLRQVTFARGQQMLIGADPDLAIKCGADGVHFRRDSTLTLPSLWRGRCPEWIITMAGVKPTSRKPDYAEDYHRGLSVLDALFISSIFNSSSPSAGQPIGVDILSQMAMDLSVPLIALGGINESTAPELHGAQIAGVAGRFTFCLTDNH